MDRKTTDTEQAFLLMHVDVTTTPPTISGIGRYSSPSITTSFNYRNLVVLTGLGGNYSEGIAHLEEQLTWPQNKWLADWLAQVKSV